MSHKSHRVNEWNKVDIGRFLLYIRFCFVTTIAVMFYQFVPIMAIVLAIAPTLTKVVQKPQMQILNKNIQHSWTKTYLPSLLCIYH